MERSTKILQGLGNQYYRATYKSMGFTTDDLKRPIIGIANAWRESVPAGEGRHLPRRRHAGGVRRHRRLRRHGPGA